MSAMRTTVATMTMACLAVTCSSADPASSATTTTSATTTSTTTTATTTVPTPQPEPATTDSTATPVDTAAPNDTIDDGIAVPQTPIGAVVITADDLGPPWSQVGFAEGAVNEETDDTEICGQQDGALARLSGSGDGTTASSRFQQSDRGPFLTTFAIDPDDGVDVRAAFDAFVAAASSCTEFTVVADGQAAIYQIEPATIDTVGDDAFAAVMTVVAGTQTVYLLIAVSLSNDVLLGASEVAFEGPPDVDFAGDLLATMVGRL